MAIKLPFQRDKEDQSSASTTSSAVTEVIQPTGVQPAPAKPVIPSRSDKLSDTAKMLNPKSGTEAYEAEDMNSTTKQVTKSPVPADAPLGDLNPGSWRKLSHHARAIAQVVTMLVFILLAGFAIGFFWQNSKTSPPVKTPTVTSLSQADLDKLSQLSSNLGTSGQTLNIGADALFRGNANVAGNLSITGRLNVNDTATLAALNIAGAAGSTGLNVASNIVVSGTGTFQKSLSVADLISASNMNISGSLSVNSINASNLSVSNINISGPLTIGHLITRGTAPGIVAASIGAGGTVSISGNDTTGTVNLNTGTGPGNLLATITFRAVFGATPHLSLTPLTDAAATSGYYVTRSGGGFQVHAHSPAAGAVLSFDYLIVQ